SRQAHEVEFRTSVHAQQYFSNILKPPQAPQWIMTWTRFGVRLFGGTINYPRSRDWMHASYRAPASSLKCVVLPLPDRENPPFSPAFSSRHSSAPVLPDFM